MSLSVARVYLFLLFVLILGGSVVGGSRMMAQTPTSAVSSGSVSDTDRIAGLEKQNADNVAAIAAAQSAGDNAWMLVSAALVLMMSGPGLALFYGGLVRQKNILG